MLKKGNRANTLHGILLIVLFSFAAFYIAGFPLVKKLSFSPLIVGIVLGMLYANSLRNICPKHGFRASGSARNRCSAGASSSTDSA